MRRLLRRAFNFAAVVSAVLFAGVLALWLIGPSVSITSGRFFVVSIGYRYGAEGGISIRGVTGSPQWRVHYIQVACTAALVMLLWLIRRIRDQPADTPGLCPSCGYDLRATPSRCPECGTEATVPAASK